MEIKQLETVNKSSREGYKPDMIVYHICDCSVGETIDIFKDPKMERSSNYIVGRDSRVYRMVDIRDKAWCQGIPPEYIPKARSEIVRRRGVNPNYYCVSIEHEGVYKETHGKLTEAQFAATVELTRQILVDVKKYYGIDIPVDREHLIGHCDINPIKKSYCPGELFPWDRLFAALQK